MQNPALRVFVEERLASLPLLVTADHMLLIFLRLILHWDNCIATLHYAEQLLAAGQFTDLKSYTNGAITEDSSQQISLALTKLTNVQPVAMAEAGMNHDHIGLTIAAFANDAQSPNANTKTCGAIMGSIINLLLEYIQHNLPLLSTHLRTVKICARWLHNFPPALRNFPKLSQLDLSHCMLAGDLDLRSFRELQEASFNGNFINRILLPRSSALRLLDIEENSLTGHLDLSVCSNIEKVFANDNELTSISDLRHNPALMTLHLNNNRLIDHPNISDARSLVNYRAHRQEEATTNIVPQVSRLLAKQLTSLSYDINHIDGRGLSTRESIKATIVYLPNVSLDKKDQIRVNGADFINRAGQTVTVAVRTALLALYGWSCITPADNFDEIAMGDYYRFFSEVEIPTEETFLAGLNDALALAHEYYVFESYRELLNLHLQLKEIGTKAGTRDGINNLRAIINDIALKTLKQNYLDKMHTQLTVCMEHLNDSLTPFDANAADNSAHSNEIWDPAALIAAEQALDAIQQNGLRILRARIDAHAIKLVQNAKTTTVIDKILDRMHVEQTQALEQDMYLLLADLDEQPMQEPAVTDAQNTTKRHKLG